MKDFNKYIETLKSLLSFKSVNAPATDDAPFGVENKKALEFFLNLASEMGFQTINYDNYAGEVIFGQGEEVGIIGHLDVVPVGLKWDSDPFTLTERDEIYYARGISDDKAPLLSCLFALKELKDSGLIPNRKFRLIAGCDEETGWRDVEYLKSKTVLPEYGFSPDGNFPLSYAEKGMYEVAFTLPALKNFYNVSGGTVVNAVCDYAYATAKQNAIDEKLLKKHGLLLKNGNVIESFGKSAHGSTPRLGINALKALLEYMRDMGEDLSSAIDCLFYDREGVFDMTNEQGCVTFSPDLISQTTSTTTITCDCRIPASFTIDDVMEKFKRFDLPVKVKERHPPVMVEKDGWFVQTLLDAYDSVMGTKSKPLSMGGSTFARTFKKGCAFGCAFPNYDNRIHDANENESKENLINAYKIFKTAIFNLAK